MDIKSLYNKRTRKTIKALVLGLVFPDPGLIIETIIEIKSIDNQIKKEVLGAENKPLVIVCPRDDCKDNQGNS